MTQGKHEATTVEFVVRVKGTAKSVYEFGRLLNAPDYLVEDSGVDTAVVASRLVLPRGEGPRV